MTKSEALKVLGENVGIECARKNEAYGDAVVKVAEIMRVLYPCGIPADSYHDVLIMVRLIDKLVRIATDNDPYGESPWADIAGYALLARVAQRTE